MAPVNLRKKQPLYKESSIERVENPIQNPFRRDKVAYLVRIKGQCRPEVISSKNLQQIAPQKIISYYQNSPNFHLNSKDDLKQMINKVTAKRETKVEKSTEDALKQLNHSTESKIEKIELSKTSTGNYLYQVKFYDNAKVVTLTDKQMIKKYPQEAIDYLIKRCSFEEAEGSIRDQLIREWGL